MWLPDELDGALTIAEQRVTVLDQLVTFLSLHIPNPADDQGVKTVREASSKALLEVATVVTRNSKVKNSSLHTIVTGQRDRHS